MNNFFFANILNVLKFRLLFRKNVTYLKNNSKFAAQFEILFVMKKNTLLSTLIICALAMALVACGGHKTETPIQEAVSWSPAPGEGGTLPTQVLPEQYQDTVSKYFTIHTGESGKRFDGQFVSSPHMLLYTTVATDTVTVYNDRYIAFYKNGDLMDFFGQQWDDKNNKFYNEAYRKLHVIGSGDDFTCYYLTEGYPNGMYAKQATIFSGSYNDTCAGLKDFQVAVLLLQTSGNPNLPPKGSIRILGDGDGLAVDTTWITSKSAVFNEDIHVSAEDAFSMFRVR